MGEISVGWVRLHLGSAKDGVKSEIWYEGAASRSPIESHIRTVIYDTRYHMPKPRRVYGIQIGDGGSGC